MSGTNNWISRWEGWVRVTDALFAIQTLSLGALQPLNLLNQPT